MKISAKTDYACKAIFELVMHWPKPEPLAINVIARSQRIPIKFLTHILLQLKTMGMVESIRGQRGGYLLVKANDLNEATEIAKGCPLFEHDGILEIREINQLAM